MLDDIAELRTFVRIVAAGSLSAASREMGLALSVVSKRLATLERRTEVRLIARSTRSLALTEEGQHLFERAQRILAEIDEAEAALMHGRVEPQGVLRVSAPTALGHAHVSAVCRDLVRAYPKISADLILTDRLVDVIDERMDVVVRIGAPKDSDLGMRKLGRQLSHCRRRAGLSRKARHARRARGPDASRMPIVPRPRDPLESRRSSRKSGRAQGRFPYAL
jgi:LysR family transcriptional regulator, transcriptional activator for dmlA